MAFMLKSTLLNPDFIAAQVDEIDVSALVKELTEEQLSEAIPEDLSFIEDAIYEVIDEQEPLLKEQVNGAVYAGYDYMLGESDSLHIKISMIELKQSLRDKLWEAFNDYIWSSEELPVELIKPYIDDHFDDLLSQLPDEYLPPGIADLAGGQLKLYFDSFFYDMIGQISVEDLPPEVVSLLQDYMEPYFDRYYEEYAGMIPDEFSLDESSISPDVMETLLTVRQYIGYFQTGYWLLIAFMVLLVAGIVLVNRNVKDSTRALGIDFLIYGALEFAGVYYARNYLPGSLPLQDIPSSLQALVLGFYGDLLMPLQMFSLGVLIAGAVLLAVSFIYRRPARDEFRV